MQQVIHTTKFHCELCNKEIVMPVYGDQVVSLTSEDETEFIDWCRHFHWIDFHRVCAICGEIVRSGSLELSFNDGGINIHPKYTDHYQKIRQGDRHGHLLIVHEKCVILKQRP